MSELNFYSIDSINTLAAPVSYRAITLSSSALDVFTDFRTVKPLVIESSCTAQETENLMKKVHMKLKLVVDENDKLIGLVSLEDLSSQEVIKRISEGYSREEISVSDLMKKKQDLRVLDFFELNHATIQDVLYLLRATNQQHCLVVHRTDGEIRGLISAGDLARQLNIPVAPVGDVTFARLSNVLRRSEKGESIK